MLILTCFLVRKCFKIGLAACSRKLIVYSNAFIFTSKRLILPFIVEFEIDCGTLVELDLALLHNL
jgi:hypothetical protein